MDRPRTRLYRNGVLEAEDFPVSGVSDHLADDGTLVWIDLSGPSRDELHLLVDELGLHELAVEDAMGRHQRPKLDHYESHLFLSIHDVHVDREHGNLVETEIDAFVDERWLVTVRKGDRFDIAPVLDRWDRSSHLGKGGVGFLLYGLLDVVIDGYFDAIQEFDEFYDDISDGIFSERPLNPSQQRHWFQMRQALVRFHRLVVPMRETVSSLMRREHGLVGDELFPYYQDVYDHVLRVSESTDSLRDLVSTIVETNISLRDYHQNQVMKKVTSWAAIVAVPTLITGWYGMNVPYPGSGETSGVIVSGGLVATLSAALYVLFRKRDWL